MKNHIISCLMIFTTIATCAVSCKKKKNDNPFSNAKIYTVDLTQYGATEHSRIVYDSYNNVDSIITIGNGVYRFKKFVYFGTSYSVTDENNNVFTLLANSNGMILRVLLTDTLSMLYNGSQLAELDYKSPSPNYPYYTTSSVSFTWTNGDVAIMGSQTYNYDLSRSGQPGDAIRIGQFLSYGRSYIKTNHLPTVLRNTASDTAEKYFYQFDSQGRINQLTKLINISTGAYDTTIYVYGY
jgi:hypothetical protein